MINAEFAVRIIKTIFYAIIIVGVLTMIIAMTKFRDGGLLGSLAGFIVAMVVFGIALKAGRAFIEQPKKVAATVFLLVTSQLLLWVLVGVCILKLELNPLAFLLGFTSLPMGIVWGYIFSTFKKQ